LFSEQNKKRKAREISPLKSALVKVFCFLTKHFVFSSETTCLHFSEDFATIIVFSCNILETALYEFTGFFSGCCYFCYEFIADFFEERSFKVNID
jgi:hypothetical protein